MKKVKRLMQLLAVHGIVAKYVPSQEPQVEDDEIQLPGLDDARHPHIQIFEGDFGFGYWTTPKHDVMYSNDLTESEHEVVKQVLNFKKELFQLN